MNFLVHTPNVFQNCPLLNHVRYTFILLILSAYCHASEVFNTDLEMPFLQNIQQLTHPEMGFEKAGEAYFSPQGNLIAFQAVPKGETQYQIYVMSLSERIPRMVSTGKGACTCAYFHPTEPKMIFASSHSDPVLNGVNTTAAPGYQRQGGNYSWTFTPYMNIYEANLDGTHLRQLTDNPFYNAECSYSPCGEFILYASNSDGYMNLYTLSFKNKELKQITFSVKGYTGGCFFSPNGKHIIFRADYEKKDYLQIYKIDSDGSNLQQLTMNGAVNWAPFWHPNGKVIAFTTSLHGHAHYEIYLLNIETGLTHRLTHNAFFDGLPVFNREGSKIMWTSKRGPDKTSQIFIADFTLPSNLE